MMMSLFVLLVVAVPLPEDKKPDDDKAKLQGTWTVVAFEIDGKASELSSVSSITIAGDKLTVVSVKNDLKDAGPATFKLDATKKPPQFDVIPDGEKYTLKYLYRLDGDTLKLYGARGDSDDRPKGYETAPLIFTLKREKK